MESRREVFCKDLSFGEKWERIIGLWLSFNGYSDISYNNNYRYDIKTRYAGGDVLFEVKTDRFPNTGNMAIEIRCDGKPSGISTTEADVFIYNYTNLNDKYVYLCFIDVKDLKILIKDNFDKLKVVNGGDDCESQMVLLPMKRFKSYFKVEALKRVDWELDE